MATNNQGGNKGGSKGNNQSGGTSNRGFASMDPARQREIASAGGRAAHASGNAHEFTSEEARQAGKLSHGGGNRQGASSGSGARSGGGSKSGSEGNAGGGSKGGSR